MMTQNAALAEYDQQEAKVVPKVQSLQQPLAFGVSVGNTLYGMPADKLNAQLDDMRSMGVQWLRIDIGWDDVQAKNAQTYDWGPTDTIVKTARAKGFEVLATLAYTPAWARPLTCLSPSCAPIFNSNFATFAGQAAKRYAADITYWEVWNEPNITKFWLPKPNAAKYADMLKSTYPVIKAANPAAQVISAGLSPAENTKSNIAPRDFLAALYKAGAGKSFDIVGYHPYSYPAPATTNYNWSAWSQMGDQSTSIRSIMQANGDADKHVWVTEYGAPTAGPGIGAGTATYAANQDASHVDEALQAYTLQSAITSISNQTWVGGFFWYSYKDLGTDPDDSENFFGMIRADGTRKPVYDTMKEILSSSTPPTPAP